MRQQRIYLHKRKNGYYTIVITRRLTNSKKRHFKFISCQTKIKSEAMIFLKNYEKNLEKQLEETDRELKLSDIKDSILSYIRTNKSKGSYEKYEFTFRKMLEIIGDKKIIEIDFNEIEKYKAELLKNVNENTVNIHIRVIKAIWNYAYKMNMIKSNKLKYIKQIKTPDNPILSFTEEEISLIEEKTDKQFRNMIRFAKLTGLRVSEMLNLQVADIKDEQINIVNKKDFMTKSKQNRVIPLNPEIKDVLNEILHIKNKKIIPYLDSESYLFKNPETNNKIDRNFVSRKFKKLIKKLKLNPKYHWHCLRAYFIMSLVRKNVNPILIKKLAGHSTLSITEKYCSIQNTDLKAAMNKVGN